MKLAIEDCIEKLAKADHVVVFSGAGMSADSGIGTFRGSSSGFWSGITGKLALAYFGTPVGWKISSGLAFKAYLKNFYKPIALAKPNDGHRALVDLERLLLTLNDKSENPTPSPSFKVITMNVDGYHQQSGFSEDQVFEVHGSVRKNKCVKMGHEMDLTDSLEEYLHSGKVPKVKCDQCKSGPRPDCVLFTESLPMRAWNRAIAAIHEVTDKSVVLVLGTSNAVYPAAGLPERAYEMGANVYQFDIKMQDVEWKQVVGKIGTVLPKIAEGVKLKLSEVKVENL